MSGKPLDMLKLLIRIQSFSMPMSLHGHLFYEATNLKQFFLRLQF